MTRATWIDLLAAHLAEDLNDEGIKGQRAKILLDRLDLADGLGTSDLADLQTIHSAIERIGTRAHQRTRD